MTIRERLELMELIKQRNDAHVRKWQNASKKDERGVNRPSHRAPANNQ